jgi:hypothetical protein
MRPSYAISHRKRQAQRGLSRKALRVDGLLEERKPRAASIRQPSRIELLERRVTVLEQAIANLTERRRTPTQHKSARRRAYTPTTGSTN